MSRTSGVGRCIGLRKLGSCFASSVFAIAATAFVPMAAYADEWAKITYDDENIPEEVRERHGALIPFDAGSYIQSGLLGHFDAIRNQGTSLPHDWTARTWKNLVSGQPDASFNTDKGYWCDKGFVFTGDVHALVNDSGIDINGSFMTIQIATTVDTGEQRSGNGYYSIFFGNNNNDTDIFFNNKSEKSTLLQFNYGNQSNRPTVTPWDGKYATAILGDGVSYLVSGTELSDGKTRTNFEIPKRVFTWGGQQNNDKYYSIGTFHAVRIYEKALGENELKWNRMLDEVRFRQADTNFVNVVVESNVAGVEATEATGKYLVNGHHTFTAPERVIVGECLYKPTGYSLEVWDAACNCWSAAEIHDGERSFAYTNCIARAKVRLIWNWSLESGVKKYDADSYVQGGLLLNYDGIRNAGLHAPHSTQTATWANLGSMGSSHDGAKTLLNQNEPGGWTDKGYAFKGAEYFTAGGQADFGQRLTAQIVTDSSPAWRNTYKTKWSSPIGSTTSGNEFILYGNNGGYLNNKYHFQSSQTSGKTLEVMPWNGRFFTVVASTNELALSDGETTVRDNAGTFKNGLDDLTVTVGSSEGTQGSYSVRCFAGRIYASRWYNRVLTDAEIKYNNDIDWCRFFGATGRSGETDLVEVRSERPEIELEDAGVYIVRGSDSSLSVSAPAEKTIGTRTYTCAGYCIETWNDTAKTWSNPVESAGIACRLDGTTGGANRRVTWLWTLSTEGLRAAADYDVSDYVQTGLVGHFDGIRNEGADIAHGNEAASLWRNLVTDCPDAVISPESGGWTNGNGFCFSGENTGKYAKMKSAISFGACSTVEVACDVDYRDQNSGNKCYPTVFSDETNHYNIFFRNHPTEGVLSQGLELNSDSYGGSKYERPKIASWGGKYVTAVLGLGRYWMFEGTAFENEKTRNADNVLAKCYAWGGCPLAGYSFGLKGVIHSVRLYNRVLTEEELARNRRVDEIRFRGIGDVTIVNGTVGETGTTGESSCPDGVYNLEGNAWTFSAADIEADGKIYKPVLAVEKWEDGRWVPDSKGFAGRYSIEKPVLSRVRLTWSWKIHRGMIMTIQ